MTDFTSLSSVPLTTNSKTLEHAKVLIDIASFNPDYFTFVDCELITQPQDKEIYIYGATFIGCTFKLSRSCSFIFYYCTFTCCNFTTDDKLDFSTCISLQFNRCTLSLSSPSSINGIVARVSILTALNPFNLVVNDSRLVSLYLQDSAVHQVQCNNTVISNFNSESVSWHSSDSGVINATTFNSIENLGYEKTDDGLIVYKTFNQVYPPDPNWIIKPRSTIFDPKYNGNPYVTCGPGINSSTLAYILELFCKVNSPTIYKLLIPNDANYVNPLCKEIIRADKAIILCVMDNELITKELNRYNEQLSKTNQ